MNGKEKGRRKMRTDHVDLKVLKSINRHLEQINGNVRAILLLNTIVTIAILIVFGFLIMLLLA